MELEQLSFLTSQDNVVQSELSVNGGGGGVGTQCFLLFKDAAGWDTDCN